MATAYQPQANKMVPLPDEGDGIWHKACPALLLNPLLEKLSPADKARPPADIQLRQRSYAEVVKGPADQLAAVEFVYTYVC
jgi:hypothetical protein